MRREFYYLSADGKNKIHGVEWVPKKEIKGIVQIVHGMVEYIKRYDEFANYLVDRGYLVTGIDLLGHGQSVASEDDLGYFGEPDGNRFLIRDIRTLHVQTVQKYGKLPYFFLGHSMGSFLTRQYIELYSKDLSGTVIMGTGYYPKALLKSGQIIAQTYTKLKGGHYRSELLNKMGIGGYNKTYEPSQTPFTWVTTDPEEEKRYANDPLCTFMFTVNGYASMFTGMLRMKNKKLEDRLLRDLPLLLTSGKDDVVGQFGKGVVKVYEHYLEMGMKEVDLTFYEEERHEILTGLKKEQVFADVCEWFDDQLEKVQDQID